MLIVSVTGCNVPKKSDVVGVYNNVGILREEGVTCILREDDTYDQISKTGILNQKGTFSRVLNGWVALKDRNGKYFENIGKFGDYFYIIDFNTNGYGASAYFEKDSDYGKLFTIDSDGKIDQTFTDFYFPTFLDEKNTMQWYTVKIQFKKDGTVYEDNLIKDIFQKITPLFSQEIIFSIILYDIKPKYYNDIVFEIYKKSSYYNFDS